ncbi:MAG: hypothetical protein GXP58_01675 [Deltaproteobacteria bacterium]|nr:hypothetical protein [Deltaproteobacteria bacterium]
MRKSILLLLLLFLSLSLVIGVPAETWKSEFEKICANVPTASSLSTERIRQLIKESNQLTKTVEAVQDPQKKVYLFRLKKCRNFFQFILNGRTDRNPDGAKAPPK